VESTHRIAIGGRTIAYRAVFREYPLSADGRPQATISATGYMRADGPRDPARPIVFFFNGGPGASSSPLHFSAFGPRLRPAERGATGPFTDNPDSPLDVADLVFVDPVGTGFSRVLPGGDGARWWAPHGDAAAMMTLIRDWLRDQGRAGAPVFIAGESYGGFRLATMMADAGDLDLRGLLLISPATSMAGLAGAPEGDSEYVFAFPSMAAAAWHHRKVDRRGLTAEQFYDAAARFADTEYLVALQQGAALAPAERARIAARMAGFIGLAAADILAADLRVGTDRFVESLLRDRGQLIGRLDARVTAPVRPPARAGRPAAANDPALGLGASNVIRAPAITRYMHDELGVPVDRDYVSLTLDVNFRWNWFEPTGDRRLYYNPLANIAAAMAARPGLRLMVVGGRYDLAVPAAGVRYAVGHAGIPLDRVRFLVLDSGHSPFEEPANRHLFAARLRAFLGAGTAE
jgi:carboxypeptidase C (cathepsin A)